MPEHVSILQLVGVVTLAASAAIWVAVLVRVLRRDTAMRRARSERSARPERSARRPVGPPRGVPRQRSSAPQAENVELTSVEREAFVDLIRRLGEERPRPGGPAGRRGAGETGVGEAGRS
ncbi:hypothetical protein [Streptomyces sp. CRN 30]|uniref:hypothetical protein n=1 Tax=Streptomyces sp. CRN 30 TaxID=3075613 RepID=UPI002A8260CE|nr:hypothetical protein [Streptomyces sp. CRN 30]